MKVYMITYGCTFNKADSEIMESILKSNGIEITDNEGESDVVVVNTCTVKKPTEQKILYKINKLKNEGKKIVAAGCIATANPELIERIAPMPIVTTKGIDKIAEAVQCAFNGRQFNGRSSFLDKAAMHSSNGIIMRVPINEGCLGNCRFCETKFARGKLTSFPEESILKAIEMGTRNGAKEIELTSQDVGAYGLDRKTNIARLLEKATSIEGDFKIRVGMLNPDLIGGYFDELVEAMQSSKVYKFMHLPIQSGSDKVIRHMNRRCTAEEFENIVRELRNKIKGISIETDIIVGYPTETEEDFEETKRLLDRVKPDVTNISKFGIRPHTQSNFGSLLKDDVVNERSKELSSFVRKIQHKINMEYIGKTVNACITEKTEISANGKTENYKQVVIQKNKDIEVGSYIKARIDAASSNALYGVV
ncbi:MAG: tRNA (N(6)-L-threonylcarbamoyladenosine(37)-C(2))-methylthiotransferase [Candidatus Micrarchaeaceae archaeon]